MRFLNKIVFINSAKTSYAEVCLDGNVHFIGTQGVGKSTLLRAILFFYNADKTKLGIDPGRQSFDQYYFPYDNSYIIYEVLRETGSYCIVAVKSAGRAAFRFISGAYDRSHFISPEGKAMVWDGIRKSLDRSGAINRKIEKYEEYRDILYGNNQGLPAEFRKYAVLESRQYQNIPRAIQSVFLNSKLDAEFIKQTIIKSLNEEDVHIDLNKYTRHLADFEAGLTDILRWSETAAGGVAPVRRLADSIADKAGKWHHTELLQRETDEQITLAWDYVLQERPKVIKAIAAEQDKLEAEGTKWADFEQRAGARKGKLQGEVAVLKSKLAEAEQKSARYTASGIEEMLARADGADDVKRLRQSLTEEQALLLKTFNDVAEKYRAQIAQAEQQLQRFLEEKKSERLQKENHFLEEKERITTEYRRLIEQAEASHAERIQEAQQAIDACKDVLHGKKLQKKEAQLSRPFEEEIGSIRELIAALRIEENGWKSSISVVLSRLEALMEKSRTAIRESEAGVAQTRKELEVDIKRLDAKISDVEAALAQSESSFYHWLCSNVPGWEANIGKVVDEQSVLFNPDLSPSFAKDSARNFFGITIDLSALSKSVKTIADYEAEARDLNARKAAKENEVAALHERQASESESIKRKFAPQISTLKDERKKAEYSLEQTRLKQSKAVLDLDARNREAVAEKAKLLSDAESAIQGANNSLQKAEAHFKGLKEAALQERSAKEKERDKKVKEAKAKCDAAVAALEDSVRHEQAETRKKISDIRQQESGALQDAGADAKRISDVETRIAEADQALKQIDAEATLVSDYRKDKRELLDKVPSLLAEKKLAEQKLQTEADKLAQRKLSYDEALKALHSSIESLKAKDAAYKEDIDEAEGFMQSESGSSDRPQSIDSVTYRGQRLKDLCKEAVRLKYRRKDLMSELQVASIDFAGRFSAGNIFGFPTSFSAEESYLLFAENLKEFVAEDKITVFEKQVNSRYADIIKLIGKETSDLVSKEGNIQKVVSKINTDFEERAFAGVIKSIQLRLSSSNDRLVCLLQEIMRFNEENSMNIGTANLFTTGNLEAQNKKAVELLKAFAREIPKYKGDAITLSDSFELQFRIVENDNDSGWVEHLSKVGSEGTDVLVKAMINIMLLNVFKESASGRFSDFKLHCMMDEIGRLHPANVKGILKFANDRNILLINCSPTSYNATDYKYTYLLKKDGQSITTVKQLVKKLTAA